MGRALSRTWQLQEAKSRLSELVRAAKESGPQQISVRGEPEVVVISKREYDRLRRPKPSLVQLMRSSPLAGLELEVQRDRSPARVVKL